MSALDDIDEHFGMSGAVRQEAQKRFGPDAWRRIGYSIRWWPRRDAPTAALVLGYDHTRNESPWVPGTLDAPGVPRLFLVVSAKGLEDVRENRFARTVELLSPIPHDVALNVVDLFEFFGLGYALRERPSTLSTNLAEVWHEPAVERGIVTFFSFAGGKFHRVTIDLTTANVDERVLA